MIEKYRVIQENIFVYIRNRVNAKVLPEKIVDEVIEKFPVYVEFYDTTPEMHKELIDALVRNTYFCITGQFYKYKENAYGTTK